MYNSSTSSSRDGVPPNPSSSAEWRSCFGRNHTPKYEIQNIQTRHQGLRKDSNTILFRTRTLVTDRYIRDAAALAQPVALHPGYEVPLKINTSTKYFTHGRYRYKQLDRALASLLTRPQPARSDKECPISLVNRAH